VFDLDIRQRKCTCCFDELLFPRMKYIAARAVMFARESKSFFFEKRSKKLLLTWTVIMKTPTAQSYKSFLVTFFQGSRP
jgi:hypothetical protein